MRECLCRDVRTTRDPTLLICYMGNRQNRYGLFAKRRTKESKFLNSGRQSASVELCKTSFVTITAYVRRSVFYRHKKGTDCTSPHGECH